MLRRALVAIAAVLAVALPTTIPASAVTGPGWKTVLSDNFDSGGVPAHWSKYSGGSWKPGHVYVANGNLVLLMRYDKTGPRGAGWYTGAVQVADRFGGVDQAVTLRYRVVRRGAASHHIIPMRWVDDPRYQWYQGEADFAEGSSLTGATTFLHYGASRQVSHDYAYDQRQWHTVRFVEWHHIVRAFVDGKRVWEYRGTQATVPDAVRRAVLQQEPESTSGTTGTEQIQVAWIRIENATS